MRERNKGMIGRGKERNEKGRKEGRKEDREKKGRREGMKNYQVYI